MTSIIDTDKTTTNLLHASKILSSRISEVAGADAWKILPNISLNKEIEHKMRPAQQTGHVPDNSTKTWLLTLWIHLTSETHLRILRDLIYHLNFRRRLILIITPVLLIHCAYKISEIKNHYMTSKMIVPMK